MHFKAIYEEGPKYKARPIEIHAVRWNGDNEDEVRAFIGMAARNIMRIDRYVDRRELSICMLNGWAEIPAGDYVVRGVFGEYYNLDPVAFDAMYEKVPA